MKKLILLAIGVVLLTACSQNQPKHTQKQDTAKHAVIPKHTITSKKDTFPAYTADVYKPYITKKVDSLINRLLPGWSIPNPNTWENLWFNEYKKDSVLVNYIPADFNGDAQTDYALILKSGQHKYAVWVLQSDGDHYKAIKLHETPYKTIPIDMGIEPIAKGKLNYIDFDSDKEPTPIDLKNTAIQIVYFEQSAETYYWQGGKYLSVTTGD